MDRTPVFFVGGGLPLCRSDKVGEHLGISLTVIGDFAEEHEDHGDAESDKYDRQRPLAAGRMDLRSFLQKCRIRSLHGVPQGVLKTYETILNILYLVFNGEPWVNTSRKRIFGCENTIFCLKYPLIH